MIRAYIPSLHERHWPPFEYENGLPVPYREKPDRISEIESALVSAGLIQPVREFAPISLHALAQIHDQELLDYLALSQAELGDEVAYQYAEIILPDSARRKPIRDSIGRMGKFVFDSYSPIGAHTVEAALQAAASVKAAADGLLQSTEKIAYALCRPPGHHAGRNRFGSYCYLNNAAFAASLLKTAGRCAVLDIDYHHGNGTQEIFWNDSQVLYASLHIDPAYDYPFFSGYANETGSSDAPGQNLNIPLPPGCTSAMYLQALEALLTAIEKFDAQTVVISLGFDTYQEDPFSSFSLEETTFGAIGARLSLLNKTTLVVQEGGYCIPALGSLAVNFFSGLLQRG